MFVQSKKTDGKKTTKNNNSNNNKKKEEEEKSRTKNYLKKAHTKSWNIYTSTKSSYQFCFACIFLSSLDTPSLSLTVTIFNIYDNFQHVTVFQHVTIFKMWQSFNMWQSSTYDN